MKHLCIVHQIVIYSTEIRDGGTMPPGCLNCGFTMPDSRIIERDVDAVLLFLDVREVDSYLVFSV